MISRQQRLSELVTSAPVRIALALLTAATLASLAACDSSAQFVLKRPVLDKCEAAGLSGCPDIADGVVLYVEGKEQDGAVKVMTGAAQNSPAQIKQFALAIRQLESIPGADDYVGPLLEIAQFLTKTYPVEGQESTGKGSQDSGTSDSVDSDTVAVKDDDPTNRQKQGRPPNSSTSTNSRSAASSDLPRALTADSDPSRIATGMTAPETSVRRFSCGNLLLGGTGHCVKSMDGPFVITDMVALTGCPDELFAAVRDPADGEQVWVLDLASQVHGARMLIPSGHELIIGARAASGATLHQSMACRVMWSGFRPYGNRGDPTGP